jgi:hypothetical protein
MKRNLLCTFGLAVTAVVALGASPVGAASGTGPYYATPSWDQQLPASTRFIVLSNWVDSDFPSGGAAVLDRETGLVWERSPQTKTPFAGYIAPLECNTKLVGGRPGWRLPTVQELASLLDPSQASPPYLPAGHPFMNVQSGFSDYYWTSTTNDNDGSPIHGLWIVRFSSLSFAASADRNAVISHFVWCVRGGSGLPNQ